MRFLSDALCLQCLRGKQPVARLHVQSAVLARDERGLPVHLDLLVGVRVRVRGRGRGRVVAGLGCRVAGARAQALTSIGLIHERNDNTTQEEHLPTTLPVPIPHKVYATHRERAALPDSRRDGASTRTAPQASTNGNAKPPTTLAAGPCSSPQNAASRSRRLDSSGR